MNRIFKFRGASNLDLEAFHDDYLWFSSFPELNDPFEGGFKYDSSGVDVNLRIKFLSRLYKESNPQNYNDIVTDVFASLGGNEFSNFVDERAIDACRSFGEEHQKNNFIHSFSIAASDDEFPQPLTSMLLWSHYANGFKGFCIEFDFDKLKESLSLLNDTNIGSTAVHYPGNCEFPTVSLKTFMLDILSDGGVMLLLRCCRHSAPNILRGIMNVKDDSFHKSVASTNICRMLLDLSIYQIGLQTGSGNSL